MLDLKRNSVVKARFIADANNGQLNLYDSSNSNKITLLTNGYSFFNGGNVGIGTTSPSEKLTVDGKIKVTATNNASIILQEIGQEEYEIRAAGSGLFFKNDGDNQFALDQTGDVMFYKTDGSQGLTYKAFSGNVGIGTTSPAASALLDVASTTKGVLLPRMSTTQINAISSPAEGLTVYNTVLSTLCFFNGISWQKVTSTAM
jgi:hypothetical protein